VSAKTPLQLIVGLGNPGSQYKLTRHNAGFWFVDELARHFNVDFKFETKFKAEICKANLSGQTIWLVKPQTFMNLSGDAAQKIAHFYKIPTTSILIVHDELDLPVGTARYKSGGGHGGHNGLRDLSQKLGKEFWRLRLGVGHPGDKRKVHDYVLNKPSSDDGVAISQSIEQSLATIEMAINGETEKAMNQLHSQ